MTDKTRTTRSAEDYQQNGSEGRRAAIDAYGARASETLNEAPLIALAGGLAAGALIAALLPRTEAETRAVRPTARRVKDSARAAFRAAKDTGTERLSEMGLGSDRAGETIRAFFSDIAGAARSSGEAALDASRRKG